MCKLEQIRAKEGLPGKPGLLQPTIWKSPFHKLGKLFPSKDLGSTPFALRQSYLDSVNPSSGPPEVIQQSVYSFFVL